MTAPVEANAPGVADITKMTKMQKLAVLLVMLGPDSAAQLMKGLDEHELDVVSTEMAKLSLITQDLQWEILREFSEVAVQASTAVLGGVDYTRNVLEKAVGLFKATDVLGRVSPNRAPVSVMQQIVEMDARQIFNLVKNEQAQAISLVISYLAPERASQVLQLLRPDLREQVIERLATLAPTPVEVVEKVVCVLLQKMGGRHPSALHQTGGAKSAANILNALDKNLTKTILTSLDERNPELGQSIRQKMFTFEDLAGLDAAALQKILREVDMRDLAVALKTASERLKAALMACISKRAAETLNEEMSFLGPLRLKEIEAAQTKIIEVVRRLEGEGELDLSEARESMRYETVA
jgi:flagellar motor switch protein FliG